MAGYLFGPFRLDGATSVLWRGDTVVPLTPKSAALLMALVEQRGEVVPKAALMARVWPDVAVEESNLTVTLSALRRALGARPGGGEWVETVPRRGYRFAAPVTPDAPPLPAVAVLPFRVLSAASAEDVWGLGFADAVVTRLLRSGRFLVRPATAGLRFRERDAEEVARALAVDAVVEGTVQRAGERARVSARVVPRGRALRPWAGHLEGPAADPFALQDAAAESVAAALEAGDDPRGASPRSPERRAYEAYLRGRAFWSRLSAVNLQRAIASFQEAAALDPAFAPPHAGLADALLVLGFSGALPPAAAWAEAGRHVEAALARDATLAGAHVARAFVALFAKRDWAAATEALARARTLGPGEAAVHQWHALYDALRGDLGAARAGLERALAIDPLSAVANALSSFVAAAAGDTAGALRTAERMDDLEPDSFLARWTLGLAQARAGRDEDAVATLRRAVDLAEGSPFLRASLAWALALAGRAAEARGEVAAVEASPYLRALVEVALGDVEGGLARLGRAVEEGDPWVVLLAVDPALASLRRDPRLEALRGRVLGPSGGSGGRP